MLNDQGPLRVMIDTHAQVVLAVMTFLVRVVRVAQRSVCEAVIR